jgi:hypothetical protein
MLEILNPFKAGNAFQNLKSKKKWILAMAIVLVPILLSTMGNYLIRQKNQEVMQQIMEERGSSEMQPGRERQRQAPMGGILPFGLLRGGGSISGTESIAIGLLLGILTGLLVWVAKSMVFHMGGRILGSEKVSISSTIHLVAYTYIPFMFKGILDIVKGLTYDVPSSMEQVMFQPRNTDFLFNFVKNHFTIFVVWALFLMVVAVREQYNLSNKKAFLVVLIPYCIAWIIQMVILPASGFLGVL